MKEVGLQIYTVRDKMETPDTYLAAMKQIREIGYTHFQTAGKATTVEEAEFYKKCANEADLRICGTHFDWKIITENFDLALKIHEILGTKNMGIGSMPGGSARSEKDALLKFIDTANEVGNKLSKYGMKFTYHNHHFEFAKIEGKTIMDYLIEGFDPNVVSFVLDTYWVQHGGYDVRKMIERLAGRIDILHLKDMGVSLDEKKTDITEIGNGNINFEDIIPLAEKIGVKDFVVEQDRNFSTGDSMESIAYSYNYIKKNLMK